MVKGRLRGGGNWVVVELECHQKELNTVSNFVQIEIRANDEQLKRTLGGIPGLLAATGKRVEAQGSAVFGLAGTKAGEEWIKGADGQLRTGTGKIVSRTQQLFAGVNSEAIKAGERVAVEFTGKFIGGLNQLQGRTVSLMAATGRESSRAFGSAIESGTSSVGRKISGNITAGLVPAMANAGRSGAVAFSKPFLDAGKNISSILKSSLDSVKQGVGISLGSAITRGASATGGAAIGLGNAGDLDASTRKNATLKISEAGGDIDKALALSKALTGEVLKLNAGLGQHLTTTAKANASAYEILSSGFEKSADVITILAAAMKGAASSGAETEDVVDGMTSVLKGLGLSASDAGYVLQQMVGTVDVGKIKIGEYSSLIGKLAPTLGLVGGNVKQNFEQANAMIAISTANGVKSGAAINGLVDATKSLLKPSQEAQKVIEKLGLNINQKELGKSGLLGVLKQIAASDLRDALEEVNAAAKKGGESLTALGENPSVNVKKLITLFGTVEAVAAVAGSSGEANLKKVEAAAKSIGDTNVDKKFGVVMDGLTKKSEGFKNKLIDLDAQIKQGFATDIAAKGFEYLSRAVDATTKAFAGVDKWYKGLSESNQSLVQKLGIGVVAIAALGTALVAVGVVVGLAGAGFATLGTVAAAAWVAITGPVGLVLIALATVGAAFYVLGQKVREFSDSASKAISDWAGSVGRTFAAWGKSVIDWSNYAWDGAWKTAGRFFGANQADTERWKKNSEKIFQGWGDGIITVFRKTVEIVQILFKPLTDMLQPVIDQANKLLGLGGGGTGGTGGLATPVQGGRAVNTSSNLEVQRYGAGRNNKSGRHQGEDYTGALGANVQAIAGGIVTENSDNVKWRNGISKKAISIKSIDALGNEIITRYFHIGEKAGAALALGTQVKAGQIIGVIGSDGKIGGNTYHVDIKTLVNGVYQDPKTAFNNIAQAAEGAGFKRSTTQVSNVQVKVLDLIAKGEVGTTGREGYYKRQNGGNFSASEAAKGFPAVGKNENIGRYQVNRGDYEEARKRDPSITNFSPENQDKIALLRMRNRGVTGRDKGFTALQAYIQNSNRQNWQQLLTDLSQEWESLRDGSIKFRDGNTGTTGKNFRGKLLGGDDDIYRAFTAAPEATRAVAASQSVVTPTATKALPRANKVTALGGSKYRSDGSGVGNKIEDAGIAIDKADRDIARLEAALKKVESEPKAIFEKSKIAHAKRLAAAQLKLENAQYRRVAAVKRREQAEERKAATEAKLLLKTGQVVEDLAKKEMDAAIADLKLDVDSVNADTGAELARLELAVSGGRVSKETGIKRRGEIERNRSNALNAKMGKLSKLMAKYGGNDEAQNSLKAIETSIYSEAASANVATKASNLVPLNNLEKKVKELTAKFDRLKGGVAERKSSGQISEAGAANETSYLSGRLTASLQSARAEAGRLMKTYKDPEAIDRLRAVTNQIQEQGIAAREAEKTRKENSLSASIESINKVGGGNAKKDFDAEQNNIDNLIKAGLSERTGQQLKIENQRRLNAAVQGSIPFVERFMASWKDPEATAAGKILLANARDIKAELMAMERELAKANVGDSSAKTDKLIGVGDRQIKDADNRKALGLITEQKYLKEVLDIRIATNAEIQKSVALLEAARAIQTDPATIELYNEELAKIRQINIEAQISTKNYKDNNDAASLQGQIVASTREGLGDLFRSLGRGAKDLGSILDGLLNKIADLVINAAIGSLAGSGGGGGGLLGIIGSIFGFAKGGDVGQGTGIQTLSGISKALKTEGSGAVLATLTPGERVLTRPQAAIQRAMIADGTWRQAEKIYGFAAGGDVGQGFRSVATPRGIATPQTDITRVTVDRINSIDYVSVDQLRQVLAVQLPAAARAGQSLVQRDLQNTSFRQANGLR